MWQYIKLLIWKGGRIQKMAVISLKLSHEEENMVNFLSDFYEQDKKSLIKYSIKELYEDIIDKRFINEYEAKEKSGKVEFVDSSEILKMIKSQQHSGVF
jgi:hypothetical protein